jgi:hypothetical protein
MLTKEQRRTLNSCAIVVYAGTVSEVYELLNEDQILLNLSPSGSGVRTIDLDDCRLPTCAERLAYRLMGED